MSRTRKFKTFAILVVFGAITANAQAQESTGKVVKNELIVRFTDSASPKQESKTVAAAEATVDENIGSDLVNAALVKVDPEVGVKETVEQLESSPLVDYVEPNSVIKVNELPNDSLFSDLWNLNNSENEGADIGAIDAWERTIGSCNITVAVTDTGIDLQHPDLVSNLWQNPRETANGRDDDGNGLVDDLNGADFVYGDGSPNDEHGHGTHVAGTIGATGYNGVGVIGVSPRVKIMALKFLDGDGFGTTADAIKAIDYAAANGANVINASWGGSAFEKTLRDAIAAAKVTFVAAAGNAGANNDVTGQFPANFNEPNVISVGATTSQDTLASFSNYGAASVDVAAPGSNILSTVPGGYASYSGTSMATPHVTGAAALMLASDNNASPAQIRQAIMDSSTHLSSLTGKVTSSGRLNAEGAVKAIGGSPQTPNTAQQCDGSRTEDSVPTSRAPKVKLKTPKPGSVYRTGKRSTKIRFKWSAQNTALSVKQYMVMVNGKAVAKIKDRDGSGGKATKTSADVKLKVGKYRAYIVAVDYQGNKVTSLGNGVHKRNNRDLGNGFKVKQKR